MHVALYVEHDNNLNVNSAFKDFSPFSFRRQKAVRSQVMIRARMTSRLIGLLALSTAALAASSAMALTTQVYVGKTGAADTVGCGATYGVNPCLTLTFALTQVSPNGAVIIKETGIYDPVSIAQPVTIQKDQGVTAWIYATSTTPAVIVNNAATDDFKLLGVNVIAGTGTNSTI